MEDADVEWEIQGHSDSESNGKVSWLLNTGLWLGKKAVIAGVIVSSAPLILPPLVVFTTLGLACSVPFGLVFASYACTEKLMSKLLPSPSSCSLILESDENEELKDLEDKTGQSQPGFRKKVIMEDEEEEEVNETVNGVVMQIEFNNDERNEFEVGDILRPDSEQNPLEMRIQKPVDKTGGVVAMGNEIEDKDSDIHQQRDFGRDDSDIGQNGVQEEHEKCPSVEKDQTEEMIEGSAISMESDPNIISEFEGLNIVNYCVDDNQTCVETPEEKGTEKEEQLDYIRSGVPRRTNLDETSTQGVGKKTDLDFWQDDLDFGQNGVQEEHEKCPSVEEDRTEEMIEGSAISMESDPNIISEFERLDLVKYCVDENQKCVETLEEKCLEKEEQMDYIRSGVPRRTDLDETYLDETSTEGVGRRIELDFGQDDIDFGQNGVQEEHEKCQSVEEDQIEDIMEGSAISMESDPKIISEFEQLDLVNYGGDDNQKYVETPEGKGKEKEDQMDYIGSGVPGRTELEETCTHGVGKRIELTEVVRNELGVGVLQEDVDYRLNYVENNKEKPVGVVNNTIVNRGCEDDFSDESQGEAKWKQEERASKNKVPMIDQERYKESLSEVRQVMVVGRDTKNERKQGIEELKESEKVVLVARRVFKETDEGNVVQEDEEPVRDSTGLPEKIRDAGKDGKGMKGSCELEKIDRISIDLVDNAVNILFEEKNNETGIFFRDMQVTNIIERGSTNSEEFDASMIKTDKPFEEKKLEIGNVLGEVKGLDTENKEATFSAENKFVVENRKPVEEIHVKEGRYVKKVIGTDDGTTVGTLSADFECVKHEIENISDYSNGRVNEKNHRVLLETIVEEQKRVPQREMVSNALGEDLATRKKTLIHLNSELREIVDECGLDLLDDMNTYEYSYTVSDNPGGDNESNELLVSAGEPESNNKELVTLPDTEIHYKEEQLCEEKIWEKINALRAIVGYKAAKHSTTIEELKALYVFTGVEPPTSSDELSDIMEVNEKLQFLMLIIGVK